MTAVLNVVIPVLAGGAFLAALFFILRAWQQRSQSGRAAYDVGRQEARQAMQIDLFRGLAALVVALILLGVFGLTPSPAETAPQATPSTAPDRTTVPSPTMDLVDTAAPSPTTDAANPSVTPQTVDPTATTAPPTATDAPPTPTVTLTATSQTAVVNSGVGVWLRAVPGTSGEQLEWVLDGTVLIVLEGTETADDLEWQYVQTPDGNVGWVAVPYIVYNEP